MRQEGISVFVLPLLLNCEKIKSTKLRRNMIFWAGKKDWLFIVFGKRIRFASLLKFGIRTNLLLLVKEYLNLCCKTGIYKYSRSKTSPCVCLICVRCIILRVVLLFNFYLLYKSLIKKFPGPGYLDFSLSQHVVSNKIKTLNI